ncbi:MAG: MraY family glycosyltransferase [Candidatus Hydrogenedentota bacterium]
MITLFFCFLVIFFTTYIFTIILIPLIIKLSLASGAIDKPGLRKIHTHSKPRLGGLAFYFSFWVILSICWILGTIVGWTDYSNHKFLTSLLIGSFIIFIVGLYDDIFSGGPYIKLTAQIIGSIIVILSGTQIYMFIPYKFIGIILTLIWIVGITNSFNLLDNMDGLSGGLGAICSLMMFIMGIQQGSVLLILISVIFCGSMVGFLKYNFYPSKIFMGDSGSYFIGFILSVISVETTYVIPDMKTPIAIIAPLLIFSVPIFDTLSVIYIRIREKRPIFRGDMSHFSHRLTAIGMTQKQAVLFIYLVSFVIGISAIFLPHVNFYQAIVLLAQACTIFAIIVILMRTATNVVEKNIGRDFDDYSEYY